MNYILAFLFAGFVCGVSQVVLEKSKLTPGHINSALVIIGCILSGFGIYDKIISIFNAGATILIVNFGHSLVLGASEGFLENGIIGLFKGILINSSAVLSAAIFSAFIVTLVFKPKH